MTDFSSLQLKVDDLKAKVEQNSITPPYLGAILDTIIELMAAIDISDRETDISTALSNSQTSLSSLNALTPQVSANKSAIDALTPRLDAAEGAINAETSERQTAVAALQTALDALKTRVTTAEGGIATNAGDIDTLMSLSQDHDEAIAALQAALNALSGAEDTTAVIDTFNEVVDFLAGITNDETLSAKLVEIKTLIKQNADDIDQLQQASNDTSAVQNSHGAAIGSLQTSMDTLSDSLSSAQNELGELSQMLVDYEDDAALALSNAEARLGRRIDAVGILPFNSIVEAHSSVIDGAPDDATQFPSMADGTYRHIIFDKSRGTFLWEIHTGDYPNCPAGDAYRAWTGSEEYLSEGHPRTDTLYRMGNDLYRWDGTALVSYNDTISAAKYATFDAQWTAAGGTVIESGKTYECNGTDDLTLAEAIDIYSRYSKIKNTDLTRVFFAAKCRALLPIWSNGAIKLNSAFQSSYIRKIVFKTHQTPSVVAIAGGGSGASFHTCGFLREIDGILDFTAEHDPLTFTFRWCDELREVRVKGLHSNALLTESSHLSLATMQYLVANATNSKAITVTVHPDVYAKLSGDTTNAAVAALSAEELTQWQQVLADAIAKNISIATV